MLLIPLKLTHFYYSSSGFLFIKSIEASIGNSKSYIYISSL
jgi:hypothetical protein